MAFCILKWRHVCDFQHCRFGRWLTCMCICMSEATSAMGHITDVISSTERITSIQLRAL